jgi:hypothetical protein
MRNIKFGMAHSLCTFRGKYFEYNGVNGDIDPDKCALTIGGFKSTWLADLVAAYILEITFHFFQCTMIFVGIHCDDGLLVFCGKCSLSELH